MDKVLVERPRKGGYSMRRKRRLPDGEALPKILGVHRDAIERGGDKMLNEYLSPLRRYLAAQVNRPWNKVYSEIRTHIKPGNTVQEHVLTHMEDFLYQRVRKVEPRADTPCGLEHQSLRWSGKFQPVQEGKFYVDPDDGIIKRARRRLRGPAPRPPGRQDFCELSNGRLACKRGGVWYFVTDLRVTEISGNSIVTRPFNPRWDRADSGNVQPMDPRQMSRGELRRYGLENDAPD